MKMIFFGSSEFSIPSLEACLGSSHQVVLVVTTPDKRKGRGLKVLPNVVRQYCLDHAVPVEAYASLKNEEALEGARRLEPDLFVAASYGKLIPQSWLELPRKLCLNVHPSLLPKYRGASPLNGPILAGEKETGVSIADITKDLDAGDIYAQKACALDPKMDAARLSEMLAGEAARLLAGCLKQLESGELSRKSQDASKSTYAPKLTKQDGLVSFKDTAVSIDRKVRGLKPWPGAYFLFEDLPVALTQSELGGEAAGTPVPGTLLEIHKDGGVSVATGQGILKILKLKPAGKKVMPAADFIRGRRLKTGFVFK